MLPSGDSVASPSVFIENNVNHEIDGLRKILKYGNHEDIASNFYPGHLKSSCFDISKVAESQINRHR